MDVLLIWIWLDFFADFFTFFSKTLCGHYYFEGQYEADSDPVSFKEGSTEGYIIEQERNNYTYLLSVACQCWLRHSKTDYHNLKGQPTDYAANERE